MTDPAQQRFTALFGPEFGHGKPYVLAPLQAALHRLGDPQRSVPPIVHVAGANGKGSTIAFMRAIAEAAGLRVHVFTKPHLHRLAERFALCGAPADDALLVAAAERVFAAAPQLSQFDAQIAAMLLLFTEHPADLALVETGLGGRNDSTNVVTPALCVLTPIGRDHVDVLGSDIAAIAAHKAGIVKAGAAAIVGRQPAAALAAIERRAAEVGAPLVRHGIEWDAFAQGGRLIVQTETRALDLPLPALRGPHQIDNAGLACAALLQHGLEGEGAFAAGVAQARWPGRFEPLTRGPLSAPIRAIGGEVWVDGAHNEDGAAALARALAELDASVRRSTCAVIGMHARKDVGAFVAAVAGALERVVAIDMPGEARAAGAQPNLIACAAQANGLKAECAASLPEAIELLAGIHAGAPAPRIVICGSLALAAEALRLERAQE